MEDLESLERVLTSEGDLFFGKVKDAATDVLADGLDALLSSTTEAHSAEKDTIEKVAIELGQHLNTTLQGGINEFVDILKYKAFVIPPQLKAATAVSALENSSTTESELQQLEQELSQLDEAYIKLSKENSQRAADVQHLQAARAGLELPESVKKLAQDIQAKHEQTAASLQATAAAKQELDEFRHRAATELLFIAGGERPQ